MKNISPDDIQDVMEIAEKMRLQLYNILKEHEYTIGFAALNLAIFCLLFKNKEDSLKESVNNILKFNNGLVGLIPINPLINEKNEN